MLAKIFLPYVLHTYFPASLSMPFPVVQNMPQLLFQNSNWLFTFTPSENSNSRFELTLLSFGFAKGIIILYHFLPQGMLQTHSAVPSPQTELETSLYSA